jgi:hypothetical protein
LRFTVTRDEAGLFLAQTAAESCQLRNPLLPLPASAQDGSAYTERALRSGMSMTFRNITGEPSRMQSSATADGPFYFVTGVDSKAGQVGLGYWFVGKRPLFVFCLSPGSPLPRLLTLVGAKAAP